MKHPVGLRGIILQQNQRAAKMKKNCWVYILRNESGEITIGFEEPFDGLAHKHLLDSLSKDTINHLVRRNREQTEIYKEVFLKTL
mgnify:CR=1 FL=1